MEVPKELADKLRFYEEKIAERSRYKSRETEMLLKQRKEMEADRETRRAELLAVAEKIVGWIIAFYRTDFGQRFIWARGSAELFDAKYWQGLPIGGDALDFRATISINTAGEVVYCESYRATQVRLFTLADISRNLVPSKLFEQLHPEYLEALWRHLESGAVWSYLGAQMNLRTW